MKKSTRHFDKMIITLYIGIASALFAAARLGIIAIPHVKRRFAGGGED